MKTPFSLRGLGLAAVLFFAAIFGGIALFTPPAAEAQLTPTTLNAGLSNAIVFTNMASSNLATVAAPVAIRPGHGVSISCQFAADNSAIVTSNNFLVFAFSDDGTNYSTEGRSTVCHCFTPAASADCYTHTNIPRELVGAAQYIKAIWFTNGNNATCMVSRLTNILITPIPY